jgi:hypothetical protein
MIFPVDGGDVYVMSEKAVGTDWLKKNTLTLRHAAGCAEFTTIKEKKKESGVSSSNKSNSVMGKRKAETNFSPLAF